MDCATLVQGPVELDAELDLDPYQSRVMTPSFVGEIEDVQRQEGTVSLGDMGYMGIPSSWISDVEL